MACVRGATIWKIETPRAKYIRRLRLDAVKQNIYTRFSPHKRHQGSCDYDWSNHRGGLGGRRRSYEQPTGHANETLKTKAPGETLATATAKRRGERH